MSEGAPDRDARRPAPAQLLQVATRDVARRLLRSPDAAPQNPADEPLLRDLERFQDCLLRVLAGEDASGMEDRLPASSGRLAPVLRHELLTRAGAPGGATLSILRALDALECVGSAEHPVDPEADLRAWLSRPDAFELLVEVAHDLRSPLTSILFLSETLREGHSGALNELQRSQLGLVYSAALGLISVTSDLVELAKDEKNLVEASDIKPFSVAEVVHGVAEMVRPMAEEKGIELRVQVPDLEQGHGHPMAISRILLNLATNGLKFTSEGYVEIGVTRRSQRFIDFHVRDTGRGIPAEQLEQLFQPFRKRARGDTHFFSGSGLGLSICRKIVRAMGSELDVESRAEWGTRFQFTLDVSPPR